MFLLILFTICLLQIPQEPQPQQKILPQGVVVDWFQQISNKQDKMADDINEMKRIFDGKLLEALREGLKTLFSNLREIIRNLFEFLVTILTLLLYTIIVAAFVIILTYFKPVIDVFMEYFAKTLKNIFNIVDAVFSKLMNYFKPKVES